MRACNNVDMAKVFVVRDSTVIRAPIERCFRLSTSIEIVQLELKMRPVRGRTSGLVAGGDTIRWQGWQLGLPQFHESLIEEFRPYGFFRDRMIAGRFAHFEHDHRLVETQEGVRLSDELRFSMRWGWPGALVGRWLMIPHIRGLLRRRFALIKSLAEGDGWRRYLEDATHAGPSSAKG